MGRFGTRTEEVFVTAPDLKQKYGEDFGRIPTGAIGLYTYMSRLEQGMKQLMCGARKFTLDHLTRDDLASLTHEMAEISGIDYVMDCDKEEAEKILDA